MKAIIAGGRNFVVGPKQRRWLDGINAAMKITEVVSGGAPGADAGGEKWALDRGIDVTVFRADWGAHGNAAGPLRNAEMAQYCFHNDQDVPPNLCILFPGGRGTDSMRRCARKRHLHIIEYVDLETS